MGKIHSIETFGAVDGPGIRYVIFVQGCPMRCLYCHNPDTWDCSGGQEISAEKLLSDILKYKNYFGNNGGVTVSGGEPLMQIEFVTQLFKLLKNEGIHTCLDTSGILFNSQNQLKISELIKYTDLVLLDIKHINSLKHKELTGFDNENVLNFAQFLNDNNLPVWIRYVLVPSINEDDKSLIELKKFLDSLNNVQKVEVLPYHTLGVSKYEKLNIPYKLSGVLPPSIEQIDKANKILRGEMIND